jgi:hypothetical protein
MRLISNGSKHCIIRNSEIKEKTIRYEGTMENEDFHREDFDVDRFEILLGNGKKIDFEDCLKSTITFWKEHIEKCNLPNASLSSI